MPNLHVTAVLLAIVASAASPLGCKPTVSDQSIQPGDAELVKQMMSGVGEMDRVRRETMASAEGKVFPRPDLGECPAKYESYRSSRSALPGLSKEATGYLDIPPYDAAKGDDFIGNFADELPAISGLGVAFGAEVSYKPGPRMFRAIDDAKEKTRSEYDRKRLRERADKTKDVNDFELIIDKEVPAKLTSETEFEPGVLRGRFYVWDYSKEAIACMARILVLSSEKLRIQIKGPESASKKERDEKWERGMRGDLREQALEQAKTRLYVAGPLPDADPDDDDINKESDGGKKDGGSKDAGSKNDAGRADAGKTGVRDAGAK